MSRRISIIGHSSLLSDKLLLFSSYLFLQTRGPCQGGACFFFSFFDRKETNPELIHCEGTRVRVGETKASVKRASVFFSVGPCHSAGLHPPPPPPLLKGQASSPCHMRFIHSWSSSTSASSFSGDNFFQQV